MKTYLFDFDGTLVDSMPTFGAIMLKILDEHGVSYGKDLVKIITPLGYKGTAEYFIKLGVNLTVEKLLEKMHAYATIEYEENIVAKQNVKRALTALKERGNSLNVLTASPHTMLDVCLKREGLYELFDNVWSCDDFNTTKANPEIYRMASSKLGVPVSDVIFLDDNYNALKTAKTAGMQVYGVYDLSSSEYAIEIKSITDRYINDFIELI